MTRSISMIIRYCVTTAIGAFVFCVITACSSMSMPWPLNGLVYSHIKYPLTQDLNNTKMPCTQPYEGKILIFEEPFTGLGINARLDSNAIGTIAKEHGLETLYFADQEWFSILGIWKSHKVILYGE